MTACESASGNRIVAELLGKYTAFLGITQKTQKKIAENFSEQVVCGCRKGVNKAMESGLMWVADAIKQGCSAL